MLLITYYYKINQINVYTGPSVLSRLPPNFLRDAESAGDRLVAKASQLIQNKTTNITENFMSIRYLHY